jgi:hypothetical protein
MKLSRKRKLQMLTEIIDNTETTTADRLKALAQYEKLKRSKKKGKPRGRPFVKKKTPLEIVLEQEAERRAEPSAIEQQIAQQHNVAESRRAKETTENPPFAAPESAVPKAGDGAAPSKMTPEEARTASGIPASQEMINIFKIVTRQHEDDEFPYTGDACLSNALLANYDRPAPQPLKESERFEYDEWGNKMFPPIPKR